MGEGKNIPLSNLKVIDLADEKASFCSKLLADLGAQVIKIENPNGDSSRNIGPFLKNSSCLGTSLFFQYNNNNKLSVTLNLEDARHRHILLKWLKSTDILIESFPPGYLKSLELDYESISYINPELIMVSVTGFGQKGPRRDYKSCDLVASAFGGQMYVTGTFSSTPLKIFGEQSYYIASLFAAIGILISLRKRRLTGQGEYIDISLQEAVASTLDHVMIRYFYEGTIPERQGNIHWDGSFFIIPCKNGHILLSLFNSLEIIAELMKNEGLPTNIEKELIVGRAHEEENRLKNIEIIIKKFSQWTRRHTKEELFEMGQLMRLPWAPVCSPKEVLESPQLRERNFFLNGENFVKGIPGHPYRFKNISFCFWKKAPEKGEHNFLLEREYPWAKGGELLKNKKNILASSFQAKSEQINKEVLSGIRILDFTWMLAGPYATRILADFGAEVIKVQSGRTTRRGESNLSGYFNNWNRNKKSITLDLSCSEAREIIFRLASKCDVLIENFSPRVMRNWGLNYEKFKEINPNLIMVSMSAMGQTGPWKNFVAFGPTIHALSGITYLSSFTEDNPIGPGFSYADIIAGLYAAFSVLLALEHRDNTNEGNYIDLSEYEAMCTLLGPIFMDVATNGTEIKPEGNKSYYINASPYGCYRCAGRNKWCVIAVFNEAQWKALCHAMNHPELVEKEKFSCIEKRKMHDSEIDCVIEQWTSEHSPAEITQILQEAGVPAGIVQNAEDLFNDPHLQERVFFVPIEHPILGKKFTDVIPIRFSKGFLSKLRASPLLGEDNKFVFEKILGIKEDELSSHIKRGIVS